MGVIFPLEEKSVPFSPFYPTGFARIHSELKWVFNLFTSFPVSKHDVVFLIVQCIKLGNWDNVHLTCG